MAVIQYTKTNFVEPGIISEVVYNQYKREISKNPNYEIDPNPETFSDHFKGSLSTIKIAFVVVLICLIAMATGFDKQGNIMAAPVAIGIIVIIFTGINLLLEGPSFATYIKEKTDYFERMKYAIENTSSYLEYLKAFYNV